MLEDNLFGDLVPGNNVPNSSAPTYIPAPPKVPTPSAPDSPLDAEAKRLEIELKKQRLAKGEPAGAGEAELKAAEQKATFLTTNLLGNVNIMQKAVKADPSSTVPTWDQLAAGVLGSDIKNAYLPAQRQVIENSQRLITDAALTLGTGAAYTPEQIEAYRRGFFPQVWDKPETIQAKREALKTALVAARLGAGAGAGKIDEAMQMLGFSSDPISTETGALPTTVDTGAPKAEEDWPIGAVEGDWKRVDETTLQNIKTGERSLYTGTALVGGGEAKAKMDAEAKARAEAYRQKQDRTFGKDSPTKTMLVSGMSGKLSDEAAGIGAGLSRLLTGQNPIEGYITGRDAERLRIEDARSQLGGWGTAAEIGGGFLSFNPEAALAPATSALATFTQGAKAGAGGGALYGFGSGEGFGDSMEKAAVGSALGAFAGAAVPAIGMGASRLATPLGRDVDLAAAAQAENVRLRSPMLNDNSRRIKMGGLEGTSGGAPVIQRAIQETTDDISAAATRAGGPGAVYDDTGAAGEVVQSAGRRFIQRTKGVADRLYNRARSLAGPDATVTPREGLSQLRRELQDLRQAENVNSGEIDFINDVGADLTKGPLTVEAIRAIRQGIRGRINEKNLTSTQAEARAHRILDALQQDVTASLPSAAASAFRRADTYYRERMTHIDDVLEKFIGNTKAGQPRLSGEQAFSQLRSMTAKKGGDSRRLAALWRDMTPDEQADISATIMNAIGRRANQTDAPFSIDLFITQASSLSPSARRTIFGPSGAESVNRLIRLSRALQASQKEVNKTKSGSTVMRTIGGTLAAALMGGGGGAAVSGAGTGALVAGGTIAGMLAKVGANNLSARALMSPRVSTWLADVANATTGAQIQALGRRLGVIAAREPALANELVPLQQALSGQARVPLAAAEGEDEQ